MSEIKLPSENIRDSQYTVRDENRKEQVSFPLIDLGKGMKGLILQGSGLEG